MIERPDILAWRKAIERVRSFRINPFYMPGLILISLDLIEERVASPTYVPFSTELKTRFDELMQASGEKKHQVHMPFNFLAGRSRVWTLWKDGIEVPCGKKCGPRQFQNRVDHAEFEPDLRRALDDPEGRQEVRQLIYRILDPHPKSHLLLALADQDFGGVRKAQNELLDLLRENFQPTCARVREETRRDAAVRNRAFTREVIAQYDFHCCLCGSAIRFSGFPEVEAAHIVPVAEGGPDDLRNGFALCRTHHWCFDQWLWSVNSAGRIDVARAVDEGDQLHELTQFRGRTLLLPRDARAAPHPRALEIHREAWVEAGREPS